MLALHVGVLHAGVLHACCRFLRTALLSLRVLLCHSVSTSDEGASQKALSHRCHIANRNRALSTYLPSQYLIGINYQ